MRGQAKSSNPEFLIDARSCTLASNSGVHNFPATPFSPVADLSPANPSNTARLHCSSTKPIQTSSTFGDGRSKLSMILIQLRRRPSSSAASAHPAIHSSDTLPPPLQILHLVGIANRQPVIMSPSLPAIQPNTTSNPNR
ncbi:hypothetical protein L1887_15148 [Cichorium endivia]|nr:hypothetical protein L1887_15148 [Cichorium endivia]